MATLTGTEATELFRRAPERYIDVGAGEAAYRRVGRGPDVLFVHGWPLSSATYRRMLPHLVDDVTCHLVDLPSAGSSKFDATTPMSIAQHIESVRRIVETLGLKDFSVVAHDSGGMIARHALAGDPRVRSMGLINTEQSDPSLPFRAMVAARRLPGLGAGVGWVAGRPRLRRSGLAFGPMFADSSLVDGEFAEFFLEPLHRDKVRRKATIALLRSLDPHFVSDLRDLHAKIDVPVKLVWGDRDKFFPVKTAKRMVDEFPDATLDIIEGASTFSQEERPAEISQALLPTLVSQT